MSERERRFPRIAAVAFVVAVVGYVALGWRFGDGTSDPLAVAIALVAVGVAVAATVRQRL